MNYRFSHPFVQLPALNRIATCLLLTSLLITAFANGPIAAQEEISSVRELALQGTVEFIAGDQLVVTDADGKSQALRIQTDPLKPIMLSGKAIPVNAPARISVTGAMQLAALDTGMVIEIHSDVTRTGQVANISRILLQPPGTVATGIEFTTAPPAGRDVAGAIISGRISSSSQRRITIEIPRSPEIGRNRLVVDTSDVPQVDIAFGLTGMIRKGDIVNSLRATEVSTGDIIVRSMNVELVGLRDDPGFTVDQRLQLKYAHLPNDPLPPREESSRHFLLRTDLSERRTAILLDKLETMVELINGYFGRKLRQPIQCVVVSNLANWNTGQLLNNPVIANLPNVNPEELRDRALAKIRIGEGMTVYGRIGRDQAAVVVSAANDSVVQHEAVHGYCFLLFGSTGPLWYAEGMAEVGRFWEPDNLAINADPAIIGYLRDARPQSMSTIVYARQIEGETWKAYAWRWVLCHMLVNNPNYAKRIRKLGIQLMNSDQSSFEDAFGDVANEVSFEYLQFLKHLNTGLRADLTAWDWSTPNKPVAASRTATTTVVADRGWQSSGVLVEPGVTYQFSASGNWQLDAQGPETDANGRGNNGHGRLIGVLLNDYQLSEEFDVGTELEWTAPQAGVLYLRCREPLANIADNSGEIDVRINRLK